MPRPLLHRPQAQEKNESLLTLAPKIKTDNPKAKLRLDRLLRRPRSKEYLAAIKQLDSGGHTANRAAVQAILQKITNEFPEVELSGYFLGILARCYLGEPYEVHTLDLAGGIIEHYKRGAALPAGMEKARPLAFSYEFVEVYTDCCRAVSADGSVAVVK